jgi:hypothetical protein
MSFWELFWVTIGSVFSFVILLILLMTGSRYSVSDTEAQAEDYAGVIKEGRGGVTVFLWVLFIGLFIWTIAYFVMNWNDFAIIAAYTS